MLTPNHIAIVMDGNGRWAKNKGFIRTVGHKNGVEAVKRVVKLALTHKINYLTLFAFGQENWQRPKKEVNYLMQLMLQSLSKELKELHTNNIKLNFIGDLSKLDHKLQQEINNATTLTNKNTALNLTIALNYSGRYDITQAIEKSLAENTKDNFEQHLLTKHLPDPDLFIRTSGEQRISNFFLWQLAYTELYFTDTLWPDFAETDFVQAINSFAKRQRRYGKTSEQLKELN